MTAIEFVSTCPEQTQRFGEWLGSQLPAGIIVPLLGPIGAGKTWLARGICSGFGMEPQASFSSPTYTLMHTYPAGDRVIHHFDFYRLSSEEDIETSGFWDWLGGTALVLIEWPELVLPYLPPERLEIRLLFREHVEERIIHLETNEGGPTDLLEEISRADTRY